MTNATATPSAAESLRAFICQRPNFEPRNYFQSWADTDGRRAYRSDVRTAGHDRADALALLAYAETDSAIWARIMETATAGRDRLNYHADAWDYTAGQYWCVEYRAAAAHLLASAIRREWYADLTGGDFNANADKVRQRARRMFGQRIARRYF